MVKSLRLKLIKCQPYIQQKERVADGSPPQCILNRRAETHLRDSRTLLDAENNNSLMLAIWPFI